MKRVCIIRRKHYPWQKNMRRNAETLVAHGYHVDVICLALKGEKKFEVVNGVNVHRMGLSHHRGSVPWYLIEYTSFFVLAAAKLARLSLRKRYDVVEVHTMPDYLVFITFFAKLTGSKILLYMFENMPGLFMSTYKKGPNHIGSRVLRLIERLSAGYAHHVIVADGLPYKKVLVEHGVPADKVTVVLNVPDDAIFDLESHPNIKDGEDFRLFVVSTLIKRYGIQVLIKAVPLLIDHIPELKVEIVGDGEYRKDLERLAREFRVEKYISFTGLVRHDDVPAHVSRADIAVAPMIDDVGHPNKIFEYFAMAKPTVASALPSLLATFDSDSVLYYRPGDEEDLARAVLDLYRDPERRASLAKNGHIYYEANRWKNMKHTYLRVYEELTS